MIALPGRQASYRACSFLAAYLVGTVQASAHAGEGAVILLLPTELYIVGGAIAVLVSFGVLALFHRKRREARARGMTFVVPRWVGRGVSLLCLAFLSLLIVAGFTGTADPFDNSLPLAVWTLWWVGFTLLVVIAGNLWSVVNPWIGLYDILRWPPLQSYPERWGYLPAAMLFFGFTWFELIYVAPQDPERLATVVVAYWLFNFGALLIFGPRWLERGEAFSVFFAIAGGFSPLQWRSAGVGRPLGVSISIGQRANDNRDFADLTGVLFILVTLSSISFDGFSRTFFWLGYLGVNPLEFPGRSAVLWQNSAGLAVSVLVLGAIYWAAIELGPVRTGLVPSLRRALGLFVLSLVPISIAYHLAHYLPSLFVGFPSAALTLVDPLGLGWSPLPDEHPGSSMGLGAEMVVTIYRLQTAIIVVGHILATFMAHRIALTLTEDRGKAVVSEIPLALLMVGYTVFGLWLLSTPQIG